MKTEKECRVCKEVKSIINFKPISKNTKNKGDGYEYYCRDCRREYERDYYHMVLKPRMILKTIENLNKK
jgi:hypothetical protein